MRIAVLTAVVLAGSALAGEAVHPLLRLSLDTAPQYIASLTKVLPGATDGPTYRVLAFETGHSGCDGSPEWQVFLDARSKSPVSVTWRPEKAVDSSVLFAGSKSYSQNGATFLARELEGGQVLFAPAVKGQTTLAEVTLMRSAALPRFLPWLASALEQAKVRE